MTPESFQLRQIFCYDRNEERKHVEGVKPEKMKKVGVLGGGLMGGIAYNVYQAGVPVRIKDVREGIANAMKYSYDILNKGEEAFHA